MVNVKNILKVADAIEQHSIPDLGFNMSSWRSTWQKDLSGHDCGTTACIGGWADAVLKVRHRFSWETGAALGLTEKQSDALFFPKDRPYGTTDATPYMATSDQAVAVLRHLAATGKVDWSVADKAA